MTSLVEGLNLSYNSSTVQQKQKISFSLLLFESHNFTESQFNNPFLRNLIVHDNKLDIYGWLAHFLFDTGAKKMCLSLTIDLLLVYIFFCLLRKSRNFTWILLICVYKKQSLLSLHRLGCVRQFQRWQQK